MHDEYAKMGGLVLNLKAGDRFRVNGADLVCRSAADIVLKNQVDFMFGPQIMSRETAEAGSDLEKAYYAIQECYVGEGELQDAVQALIRLDVSVLQEIRDCIRDEDYWPALKMLRRLIRQEKGQRKNG